MSYYPMLTKEMGKLDFQKTAAQLCNQVRAFDPWPCAYMMVEGAPMKVWKAAALEEESGQLPGTVLCADGKAGLKIATGKGTLHILELQAQGGKRMKAQDYLRGHGIKQTIIE